MAKSIPVMRHHKPSGQARIYVNGNYQYLGKWGSNEAEQNYQKYIGDLLQQKTISTIIPVRVLVAAFLDHADEYYRNKKGSPTGTTGYFRYITQPLLRIHGDTLVSQFGTLALKAVRDDMIENGLTRKNINCRIVKIRQIFKWGVENEMVPVTVYQALCTVPDLAKGRSKAKEKPPIPQAEVKHVLATIEHCHKTIADMLRLQLLTGMRPGEVRTIKIQDIDMCDDIWIYLPEQHKTQYRGKFRPIPLNPRAD